MKILERTFRIYNKKDTNELSVIINIEKTKKVTPYGKRGKSHSFRIFFSFWSLKFRIECWISVGWHVFQLPKDREFFCSQILFRTIFFYFLDVFVLFFIFCLSGYKITSTCYFYRLFIIFCCVCNNTRKSMSYKISVRLPTLAQNVGPVTETFLHQTLLLYFC